MLRAIVLAARLGFTVDPPVYDAIERHCGEIEHSAPPRLMDEYLQNPAVRSVGRRVPFAGRDGPARRTSAPRSPPRWPTNWKRRSRRSTPIAGASNSAGALTNPILLGSLLVPLGLMQRRPRRRDDLGEAQVKSLPQLGRLPLARKDVERLAHVP